MRVAAFSAHPDDAELGAGPYLALLAEQGCTVNVLTFTGDPARDAEAAAAAAALRCGHRRLGDAPDGHLEQTPALVTAATAEVAHCDLILVNHPDDTHQDHRAAYWTVTAACRRSPVEVLLYRTPTTGGAFTPDLHAEVAPRHLAARAAAVALHATQTGRACTATAPLDGAAAADGYRIGVPLAAAFQTYRRGRLLP